MSTRTAKQLIYGALYAVVWILLAAVIYVIFIRPFFIASTVTLCTPSTCAPTSTAPISATIAGTFLTSPQHDTFLVQAVDSDNDFGAPAFDYEIDFYNASNTVIQAIPARSFIYPGQDKYLVLPNEAVPSSYDHMALNVTAAQWLESSTLGVDPSVAGGQFALQNIQVSDGSTTVSVGGQLANTSIASYEQVMVVVLFKDQSGDNLGSSETELDGVQAGETRNFSVIYPALSDINPVENQIIVYAIR
jgi:hypothetical protein